MRTEILTIVGAVLGLVVLVGALPFAGWLITRRRRTPRVLTGQRTEEMAGLHEEPLTPVQLAEARLDAAWAGLNTAEQGYYDACKEIRDELFAAKVEAFVPVKVMSDEDAAEWLERTAAPAEVPA